jgi:hypothetical protein
LIATGSFTGEILNDLAVVVVLARWLATSTGLLNGLTKARCICWFRRSHVHRSTQSFRNNCGTLSRLRHIRQEGDMTALAARFFPKASAETVAEFETMVSVALFCGVGLLMSLSVLLLDQYIPGEWF